MGLLTRVAPAVALGVVVLSGCGGDTSERQGADDPTGTFEVEVVRASFAPRQRLAETETLRVRVRNTGTETIPDIAVSLDGLEEKNEQPAVADPSTPLWIIDRAPAKGTTAYVSTWSLGALAPNAERDFQWRVTPVVAGSHTVRWRVAGNLTGGAEAQVAGGGAPEGAFRVRVSATPRTTDVDPVTGDITRNGA